MEHMKLPACRRYLSDRQKPDILYTLAILSHMIEDSEDTSREFHSLMVSERIIDQDHPLPKQLKNVSCYQVSTENHCGYICRMCPYTTKHKYLNEHEMQEAMILSYALKSYQNLKLIMNSGLQASHLTSLFLINDLPPKNIIPVIPLMNLSYQYLARMVTADTDFIKLPEQITSSLKENNKGKLLPQNLNTILSFLVKLQTGYKSVAQETVLDLSRLLQRTESEKTSRDTGCIEGFLADKPVKTQITPETLTKNDKKTSYEDELYLPLIFSEEEISASNYPLARLPGNGDDYRSLETFLQFNPLFGMEIVTDRDSKREMILLCGSDQFFYLDYDDETALSLLGSFLAKSRARKQICMDPYRLYHYLSENHLCYDNVFSLQSVYKILTEERGNTYAAITPGKLAKELISKENNYGYSPYVFLMPCYVKMYEVLTGHPKLQTKEAKYRLRRQSAIDSLMGISYEYRLSSGAKKCLFSMNEQRNPSFTYEEGQHLADGICCVTFTFSSEKPIGCLVSNLLYRIAGRHLAETHGYRLMKFSETSFTISTSAVEYEHLCDIVANLATYLSERDELIPLFIKEDCY